MPQVGLFTRIILRSRSTIHKIDIHNHLQELGDTEVPDIRTTIHPPSSGRGNTQDQVRQIVCALGL